MRFLSSAKGFTRWDKIVYQIIRLYEERNRVHWLECSWNDYQDVDPEGKRAIGRPRRKWSLIQTSLNSQIPARKWSRFISYYCRKSLQCVSGRCFGNAIWGPHVHYCDSVSGDVSPCSLVYTYNPEGEGGACLLHVGTHLPNYTV